MGSKYVTDTQLNTSASFEIGEARTSSASITATGKKGYAMDIQYRKVYNNHKVTQKVARKCSDGTVTYSYPTFNVKELDYILFRAYYN